jgi:site-specific recombinase XerC
MVPAMDFANDLAETVRQARDYAGMAKAPNTIKAYRTDWADFTAWCEGQGLQALPAAPETVACYLTARSSSCKVSTLQRRISAISQAHQAEQYDSPTSTLLVRSVWAGIRREKGTAQQGKAPAVTDHIKAMVETLPDSLLGIRDRALLFLGFAGAFRRSELVGLDVTDLEFTAAGLVVTIRRSKTDQEGQGMKKGIPFGGRADTCPVRAVQGWLQAAGISAGPAFRSVNRHGRVQPGRLCDKAVALVSEKFYLPEIMLMLREKGGIWYERFKEYIGSKSRQTDTMTKE